MTDKTTFIVADDEGYLRDILCDVFTHLGCAAVTATTVEEAVLAARAIRRSVIVVDSTRPGFFGRRVADLLEREAPGEANILSLDAAEASGRERFFQSRPDLGGLRSRLHSETTVAACIA